MTWLAATTPLGTGTARGAQYRCLVCFGVLCMDLTPLLLLQLWAVRAVCTRDRGRGRAGLSPAAVTALLWPPTAQGGHGPQDSGPLGSMDWGDGSFLTALPFWGFLL